MQKGQGKWRLRGSIWVFSKNFTGDVHKISGKKSVENIRSNAWWWRFGRWGDQIWKPDFLSDTWAYKPEWSWIMCRWGQQSLYLSTVPCLCAGIEALNTINKLANVSRKVELEVLHAEASSLIFSKNLIPLSYSTVQKEMVQFYRKFKIRVDSSPLFTNKGNFGKATISQGLGEYK